MTALLEQLTQIADKLGLSFEVSLYTTTPAPETYLVATPLTDVLDVFADNQPLSLIHIFCSRRDWISARTYGCMYMTKQDP